MTERKSWATPMVMELRDRIAPAAGMNFELTEGVLKIPVSHSGSELAAGSMLAQVSYAQS